MDLIENLVCSEISRFFINRGIPADLFFVRTKEKVEVDFLVPLPNQRFVAIEVKTTPIDFTRKQMDILNSLEINGVEKWVVTPERSVAFANSQVVAIGDLFEA